MHKSNLPTYINEPSTAAPYSAGEVSDGTLQAALAEVNFIRWLAGLEPLELDAELTTLAQHGAVLMAANRLLSHAPGRPEDMEASFYDAGYAAAAACNLIMFNWEAEDILIRAAGEFVRDDGEGNRLVLGHRRWMLYPGMRYTGFGLAQDAEGRSYAAMYVMDDSAEDADYDMICWPSAGAFPAEYMETETPWSVSFNPDRYDLAQSAPRITLTEETSGAEFVFAEMAETAEGEQYFVLGGGRFGDGPAYIFHPDLSEYNELTYGYQQNQIWRVTLEGMIDADGTPAEPVSYTVEMASLTPIDPAAVEIQPRGIELKAGESALLSAQVIPDWADDLTVAWSSQDESVATVDADGWVHAQKAGKCLIAARSVNGREDQIEILVTE